MTAASQLTNSLTPDANGVWSFTTGKLSATAIHTFSAQATDTAGNIGTSGLAIYGTNSNDTLAGASGNDLMLGRGGADTITGGNGADRFVYKQQTDSALSAKDIITDFAHAIDQFDVSAFAFGGKPQGVANTTVANVSSFTTKNTSGFFGSVNGAVVQHVAGGPEQV